MDGRIRHVHILNNWDVRIVTGFIWFKIVLHCNYCSWAVVLSQTEISYCCGHEIVLYHRCYWKLVAT
jgi:hypothetical protein